MRVAWLPATLQMVICSAPCRFASSMAANVSTVSPDWLTDTTSVSAPMMGAR